MAGWLDDLLSTQAAGQPLPGGLLAMLGQGIGPSAGFPRVVTPQEAAFREMAARVDKEGPMPPFGAGATSVPDIYGGSPYGQLNAPSILDASPPPSVAATPPNVPPLPEQYAIPPSFQGGAPYFAPDARGAESPPTAAIPSRAIAVPPREQPNIIGTIGRHILQGLQNNSNALIAGGGAMISGGLGKGFSAMAAAAPLDIAARQERQANEAMALTQQALVARGIDPVQARAMAMDPAFRKEIMQPQQHVTLTDAMGNQRIVRFDPSSGRAFNSDGTPYEQAGGPGAGSAPLPTGQEYLDKYVPRDQHNMIKAIARGDIPANPKIVQKLLPFVENYDPEFNAGDYSTFTKLRQNYMAGGKTFEENKALNTLSGHLGKLGQSADKMPNIGFKPWNIVRNNIQEMTVGSPALKTFRADLVTTQNELAKAYHGGHVSDSAYAAFNKAIGEADTPEELKATINELSGLLHSKIVANETAYRMGMKKMPLPGEYSALSEEAKNAFSRINDWALGQPLRGEFRTTGTAPAPSAPTIPSGTKVGERKQFKQGWGIWNGQAWIPEK